MVSNARISSITFSYAYFIQKIDSTFEIATRLQSVVKPNPFLLYNINAIVQEQYSKKTVKNHNDAFVKTSCFVSADFLTLFF